MAEKISKDNKSIETGMKEAGEKADIAMGREDPDDGDPSFGSGAYIDRLAPEVDDALAMDEDALPLGSSGSEFQAFRDVSAPDLDGTAFGTGDAATSLAEHGTSIPPEGFEHAELAGDSTGVVAMEQHDVQITPQAPEESDLDGEV